MYHTHHKLWVFTDYMLSLPGHPHSLFTMKRFDQPWYSNLHTNTQNKTKIIQSQQNPDWFRRKYKTNLNLAMDRENQLCIQMLADIEDSKMRPEYILIEQAQCAQSLYCWQACEHALRNLGVEIKPADSPGKPMYKHDISFRTQFDFNHTTKWPFMKPTHLYKIDADNGWGPR